MKARKRRRGRTLGVVTTEDRKALRARMGWKTPTAPTIDPVSIGADGGGYFVHTHRARSKSYASISAIPKSVVRRIESTG